MLACSAIKQGLMVVGLLVLAVHCVGGQEQKAPNRGTEAPAPGQTSQGDLKSAASIIQSAEAQSHKDVKATVKALEADQKKLKEAERLAAQTDNKSMEELVKAQRSLPADPHDVALFKTDLESFSREMKHAQHNNLLESWIVLSFGLALGVTSLITSLMNHGRTSAILAVLVGACIAISQFSKADVKANIYGGLADQSKSLEMRVSHNSHIFQGQFLDANDELSRLMSAKSGAQSGSVAQTLHEYANAKDSRN